ncbi:MAG: hypothetical protein Q8N94_00025 [Methanoregula sp.]|nr:hypothetical protein [Methanoregula sp.]
MDLTKAFFTIDNIQSEKPLKHTISNFERVLQNKTIGDISGISDPSLNADTILESAMKIKKSAGQINVIIHAWGIIATLSHILLPDEKILSLSLGAGNTGKNFDLTTTRRVAEFKFTKWQGGSESIRQNNIFKDFYYLAEFEGHVERDLYVLDMKFPIAFLQGKRKIKSVLSKNVELKNQFFTKYPDKYDKVSDYYTDKKHLVNIVDLKDLVPVFSN